MSEYKGPPPGSVVRLKSGGPAMVVEQPQIVLISDKPVHCCWFDREGLLRRDSFDEAVLEVVGQVEWTRSNYEGLLREEKQLDDFTKKYF